MNEIKYNWEYSSHSPILKYFVNELPIAIAVEHGIGLYSTPFLKFAENYKGFEESDDFRNYMVAQGVCTDNNVRKLQVPQGVELFTTYDALSDEQRYELSTIYYYVRGTLETELSRLKGLKLLLVDGYACSRRMWLGAIAKMFDIVIIHDTEEGSYEYYNYDFKENERFDLWMRYTAITPVTHTTILARPAVDINLLKMKEYLNDYADFVGLQHSDMDIIIH